MFQLRHVRGSHTQRPKDFLSALLQPLSLHMLKTAEKAARHLKTLSSSTLPYQKPFQHTPPDHNVLSTSYIFHLNESQGKVLSAKTHCYIAFSSAAQPCLFVTPWTALVRLKVHRICIWKIYQRNSSAAAFQSQYISVCILTSSFTSLFFLKRLKML